MFKPDIRNYVVISVHREGPDHDAVDKLAEFGLRLCLGRLLEERGDPETMARLGMLQQYSRMFRAERARRYARELWERYGLPDWIRRTSEVDRVPPDVADLVTKCAAGHLPAPMADASESGESAGARPP